MPTFDVVVLGAGPAGEVAAARLGDHGLKVAIVEDRLVGGECSYWACMPSKALLRPYEALAEARRVPGAAEAITGGIDVEAVLARRNEAVHDWDDKSQLPWLEDRGIELYRGRGRIVGERRVVVDDTELRATRAVILAGGTLPAMPPIPGLADVREPWTNREALEAQAVPDRLVIIGGGVVGVEMAQAYRSLGAEVTLIEGERRLLPREEEFACAQVTESLEAFGVTIKTGRKATSVAQDGGRVTVTVDDGSTVEGDVLLVALGRTPQTQQLGLEDLGFEPGRPVEADAHCQVPGHPWLYSVGDINGRSLFTHMGKYQARVATDHVLGRDTAASHGADGSLCPRVIFCDPQVAAVGHTSQSAGEAGIEVEVVETQTSGNAGGSFWGRGAEGTTRFLIDKRRGVLVGATFTGAEVQDFLHAATIAIVGAVPLETLRHATPAFPTRSEVWLPLIQAAHSR